MIQVHEREKREKSSGLWTFPIQARGYIDLTKGAAQRDVQEAYRTRAKDIAMPFFLAKKKKKKRSCNARKYHTLFLFRII